MFRFLAIVALSLFLVTAVSAADADWVSLFNGKDLSGWKANENIETFSVKDGAIVAHGKRSHLFYVGDVHGGKFKNFELMVDAMTEINSNGGIYFHTAYQEEGWPDKGFEVQVCNGYPDKRKSGSLYGVDDVLEQPIQDGEWFTQHIIVKDNHVIIKVNGKTFTEWTQPKGFGDESQRKEGEPFFPGRKIDSGTFALQGHDPKSTVHYKNIRVKVLP